jgi:hypothetical protein
MLIFRDADQEVAPPAISAIALTRAMRVFSQRQSGYNRHSR